MKLVNKNWHRQLIFEENIVNTIIFENKLQFRNTILEITNQLENNIGNFIFSKDNKIVDFNKNVDVIFNVFDLELNSKKVITKILHNIQDIAVENYEETQKIKSQLVAYFNELLMESKYDIDFEQDIDTVALLKLANFKICYEANDLIEKFLMYIKTATELGDYKLIIVLNMRTYFTEEELEEIYKFIALNKLFVINIEHLTNNNHKKLSYEQFLIFDNDYCEI